MGEVQDAGRRKPEPIANLVAHISFCSGRCTSGSKLPILGSFLSCQPPFHRDVHGKCLLTTCLENGQHCIHSITNTGIGDLYEITALEEGESLGRGCLPTGEDASDGTWQLHERTGAADPDALRCILKIVSRTQQESGHGRGAKPSCLGCRGAPEDGCMSWERSALSEGCED